MGADNPLIQKFLFSRRELDKWKTGITATGFTK